MNKDGDIKLLINAQNGDKNSFEILFKKYYSKAVNVSYKILSSQESAEDIVMDSFLDMYNLHINKELNFNSYFMRVVVNNSLNELKKSKRFITEYNDEIMVEDNSNPESIIEKNEDIKYAKIILNKLPSNQKTAFILVKYEGYSYKEAAEIMGLTSKAVEALLWRARKKLAILIGGDNNEM